MSNEPQYIQDFLAEHGLTSFDHVVNHLQGSLESSLEQSAWETIDSHLRKAVQAYSHVHPLLTPDRPRRLQNVYVPIPLESHAGLLEEPHAHDFCTKEVRAVILGHAGSGKSTLIQHLLMSAIAGGAKIPIFLRLRQLHSSDADGLVWPDQQPQDALVAQACGLSSAQDGPLSHDDLLTLLKSGRFLFLLDGYDEIGMSERPLVNRLLRRLSGFPHCSAVMTSRPEAYDKIWVGLDIQYQVRGMAKESALELIEKSDFQIDAVEKGRFLKLLEEQYFDSHHSFASNPLLLSLMYMSFSKHGQIPDRLFDFYEDAFDVLWEKHDLRKEGGFTRQRQSQLERPSFLRVLEHLSIKLQVRHKDEEPQEEFSSNDLEEMLDQARTDSGEQFEIRAFREDMYQGMHLLLKEGLSTYRFIHRSFRDYFCARYLINCTKKKRRRIGRILIKRINSDQVLSLLGDRSPMLLEDDILWSHVDHCLEEIGAGPNGTSYEAYLDHVVSGVYVYKERLHIELNKRLIARLTDSRIFLGSYLNRPEFEDQEASVVKQVVSESGQPDELLIAFCSGVGKDVVDVCNDSRDHAVQLTKFAKVVTSQQGLQVPLGRRWPELSSQWFWDTCSLLLGFRDLCKNRDAGEPDNAREGVLRLRKKVIDSNSVAGHEPAIEQNARKVLAAFKKPEMRMGELEEVLNYSPSTIRSALHKLKRQGKVKKVGSSGSKVYWKRVDSEDQFRG